MILQRTAGTSTRCKDKSLQQHKVKQIGPQRPGVRVEIWSKIETSSSTCAWLWSGSRLPACPTLLKCCLLAHQDSLLQRPGHFYHQMKPGRGPVIQWLWIWGIFKSVAWAGGSEGQALQHIIMYVGLLLLWHPICRHPASQEYVHHHSSVGWGWRFLYFGSKTDIL